MSWNCHRPILEHAEDEFRNKALPWTLPHLRFCEPTQRSPVRSHPKGLRPFIENWERVAAYIIQRVHREVVANPSDETMKCFLEELLSYPAVPSRWRILDVDDSPPPFLTINYRWNNSTLRWFSTLATFGSPQDVALQEMRIETFFPADEATRAALMEAR